MSKFATFFLLALCIGIAVYSLLNQQEEPIAAPDAQGAQLKLLSELTDEELERAMGIEAEAVPGAETANEPDVEQDSGQEQSESTGQINPQSAIGEAAPSDEIVFEPDLEVVCVLVGEVDKQSQVRQLQRKLDGLYLDAAVLDREREIVRDYFVYIPPLDTRQQALDAARSLTAGGIESFAIKKTPLENGVSLGVFKSDENSAKLMDRVRALDYEVLRTSRTGKDTFYSLFLRGYFGTLSEEVVAEKIRLDFSEIEVTEKSCEEVASASNFQ